MPESVLLSKTDGIVTVRLNRPDRLNAWNTELVDGLAASIKEAAHNDVRAVVISGAGRAFSSGADLKDIASQQQSDGPAPNAVQILRERYHPILLGIRNLEKPVVAAVNGAAAGIGLSLALSCDLVWAKQSATFTLPFVNIGLLPDGGSTAFVPAAIGRTLAIELSLLGESIDAKRAEQIGLIGRAIPDQSFDAAISDLANRLAHGATAAYAAAKRAINQATLPALEQQLELEAELQGRCTQSQDFREGVAAFVEKRLPNFSGH